MANLKKENDFLRNSILQKREEKEKPINSRQIKNEINIYDQYTPVQSNEKKDSFFTPRNDSLAPKTSNDLQFIDDEIDNSPMLI